MSLDPKSFDLNFVVRETRNLYASFVNIMDVNSLAMKKKHFFDQPPIEKSIQDYYLMGKEYGNRGSGAFAL